eukprot:CAMPEP_0206578854 /NCGR_PEP_ID=MMETSP0325_2-20121206/32207_1 /ASSEMBLY_ACC=CAM_ASM_000347 /TAXON_ID=2866 /ORGANISM="Crypthecodinium cohnii, Strain Seligo" /LENGTH=187 /DNA_ID=CAMNT_0054084565 /DNA_START=126 /DNA_END=690 /DNA_ORIENTATION=+
MASLRARKFASPPALSSSSWPTQALALASKDAAGPVCAVGHGARAPIVGPGRVVGPIWATTLEVAVLLNVSLSVMFVQTPPNWGAQEDRDRDHQRDEGDEVVEDGICLEKMGKGLFTAESMNFTRSKAPLKRHIMPQYDVKVMFMSSLYAYHPMPMHIAMMKPPMMSRKRTIRQMHMTDCSTSTATR